jgi:hypothetical protein
MPPVVHLVLLAILQAQERIELFKSALENSRGEPEKVRTAFRHLTGLKDDLLRDEAIQYVRKGSGVVRGAAAQVLAEYPGDEKAADALLDALAVDADPQTGADMVLSLAAICPEKHVKKYVSLLTHPIPFVAAHAIGASEKVRAVELIEPLILLVAELEKVTDINQLDYYAARDSIPTTMQQRRDACLDPACNALCALTDQKLSTGDQWIAWWKENKKTFKIVKK